jgi:hypothetical protein
LRKLISRPLGTEARNRWSDGVTSARPVESIDAGTNTTGRPDAGGRVPGGAVTGGNVTIGPVTVGCETPDPPVVLDADGAARPDPLLQAPMATSARTGK